MTDTTSIEALDIGRCTITAKLRFVGEVIGGGSGGPGKVYRQTDFNQAVSIRFDTDNRSGTKRSGSCVWQLEADQLYRLDDVAKSSSRTATYYVSTPGGQPVELTQDEFNAECRRRWPLGLQLAREAAEKQRLDDEARIVREAAEAERRSAEAEVRRIENDALKELNAERAAEIAEKGQPDVGLPVLSGTPKQIAYALSIREAFATKHPGDPALTRGTTAKYWIENHRSVLFR